MGTDDIDEFFSKEQMLERREQASHEARYLEDLSAHLKEHVGEIDHVIHEIISYTVHLEILVVRPTPRLPFVTIMTSGLSDRRMKTPIGVEDTPAHGYAEFIAFLNPEWPIDFPDRDEGGLDQAWPERILRGYSKWVHEEGTFYDWYHTSSNDTPAVPFVDHSEMSGLLFTPPYLLLPDAWFVPTFDGKIVKLLNVVPITSVEVDFGVKYGGDSLFEELRANNCNFTFDPQRPGIRPRRKKFFGLF
jgi:hypothetical protein